MSQTDRPMHTVPGLFPQLVALYAEGERHLAEGRLGEAIATFTRGLALDDHFRQRHVTMYAQRAFARHQAGDLPGAIGDYGQAIALEPPIHQAQYHFQRGMCFAGLGQPDEAIADFGRAIELHDGHPGPFHLRGKLLLDQGRAAEALADFDRFLTMGRHPEVLQLRGYAKLLLGRGADAIGDLQAARQLAPDVYTDYLLAWAGAVAPDDELFYASAEAVLRADPSYRPYFVDHPDYRRFQGEPRFRRLVGA